MGYKTIELKTSDFGSGADMIRNMMEIGICSFRFRLKHDAERGNKGQIVRAIGTRNLSFDFIPFDKVPFGGRNVRPDEITFFDIERQDWREFIASEFIDCSNKVIVEI